MYTLPCARVDGRVILRETVDPDGDGDVHLVAIAGPRIVTVKYVRNARPATLAGVGARIRVVGLLSRGRWGTSVVTVLPARRREHHLAHP
jgi:hypothetical protein